MAFPPWCTLCPSLVWLKPFWLKSVSQAKSRREFFSSQTRFVTPKGTNDNGEVIVESPTPKDWAFSYHHFKKIIFMSKREFVSAGCHFGKRQIKMKWGEIFLDLWSIQLSWPIIFGTKEETSLNATFKYTCFYRFIVYIIRAMAD